MELSLSYKIESPKQPNTVQHKKHSRLGPHQGSYHEESWKVDEVSVRSPRATITPCTKLKKKQRILGRVTLEVGFML